MTKAALVNLEVSILGITSTLAIVILISIDDFSISALGISAWCSSNKSVKQEIAISLKLAKSFLCCRDVM